jgi:hypothetical protein
MTKTCNICHRPLDQPADPGTRDCGGDCLRCMAEAGDPDCQASMRRLGIPFEPWEWEPV